MCTFSVKPLGPVVASIGWIVPIDCVPLYVVTFYVNFSQNDDVTTTQSTMFRRCPTRSADTQKQVQLQLLSLKRRNTINFVHTVFTLHYNVETYLVAEVVDRRADIELDQAYTKLHRYMNVVWKDRQ